MWEALVYGAKGALYVGVLKNISAINVFGIPIAWVILAIIVGIVIYHKVIKLLGIQSDDDYSDSGYYSTSMEKDFVDKTEDKPAVVNTENEKDFVGNKEDKPAVVNTGNKYADMNNAVLIRAILGDLKCQYSENEDGDIIFIYQGERFWVWAIEDSTRIRIIDVRWYDCTLDRLEEMSCMQKAINIANSVEPCTAVYVIDKEENKMMVYSQCYFMISSSIPAPDKYFAIWLSNFFHLKQKVFLEFEKEKQRIGLTQAEDMRQEKKD